MPTAMQVTILNYNRLLQNRFKPGAFNEGDKESKFKAVIFDASGIQNSEQLKELYNFFNPIARQIQTSGRVVIVGITPETAKTVKQAIAQLCALEGFVKSVAKEFKKGIAAQLVYVDEGAEANLESTVRFVLFHVLLMCQVR